MPADLSATPAPSDPTDGEIAQPDDIPPWHPYDGCHGCRRGEAISRRATPTEEIPDVR